MKYYEITWEDEDETEYQVLILGESLGGAFSLFLRQFEEVRATQLTSVIQLHYLVIP